MKPLMPLLAALCLLPASTLAAEVALTDDATWYVHADLLEMRQTVAGRQLYGWIQREILDEIEQEFGFDPSAELDGVTVLGVDAGPAEPAVILHGFISASTRDLVLQKAHENAQVDIQELYGRSVYRVSDFSDGHDHEPKSSRNDDGGWIAFGDTGQTMITGDKSMIERFLAADAHFSGPSPQGLLVLRADRALVQGGLDAADAGSSGGPWESHMLQNVRQLGLVIADDNGLMAIRAEVVATSPAMAEAVRNLIEGVISLKVLAEEEPELGNLLETLQTSTEGDRVTMRLTLDPQEVVDFLD